MTYDNGLEAAAHETVTAATQMKFYFAKTYSSWQKGTNQHSDAFLGNPYFKPHFQNSKWLC